ncbi:MAG: hypothetical protein K0A98_05885 [Trueperaceae bacterium]|nr:hypothetical protein [Trueperaceae bacterium]
MKPPVGRSASAGTAVAAGAGAASGAAVVIGVDPGRNVGLAWVDAHGALLRAEVVDEVELGALEVPEGVAVALGSGTGSRAARTRLEASGLVVSLVDERATSEEGRRLYWRCHPARGWWRWVPLGLRPPPASIDAYAAYAIALRWLASARAPASVAAHAQGR